VCYETEKIEGHDEEGDRETEAEDGVAAASVKLT